VYPLPKVKRWTEEDYIHRREQQYSYHAKHRAKKYNAEGFYTANDIIRIRQEQNDKCKWCDVPLNGGGHRDHIISLRRKGTNWPSNIQLLCSNCDWRKNIFENHAERKILKISLDKPKPPLYTSRVGQKSDGN